MPRAGKPSKPSAANRFAVSPGGNQDGKQLVVADVVGPEQLHDWLSEVIGCGASVTISLTRDLKTLSVSYFVDGERYPWYIQSGDDWDAMCVATSGELG